MIKLHLKFFKLTINLEIDCKCDKHKTEGEENAEKLEEHTSSEIPIEEYFYDDLEEESTESVEYVESEIEAQARKFAEELAVCKANVDELKTNQTTIASIINTGKASISTLQSGYITSDDFKSSKVVFRSDGDIDVSFNGLYDIPNADEIPPKYQIDDDVEIITDKFEKEVEDIIEGRR